MTKEPSDRQFYTHLYGLLGFLYFLNGFLCFWTVTLLSALIDPQEFQTYWGETSGVALIEFLFGSPLKLGEGMIGPMTKEPMAILSSIVIFGTWVGGSLIFIHYIRQYDKSPVRVEMEIRVYQIHRLSGWVLWYFFVGKFGALLIQAVPPPSSPLFGLSKDFLDEFTWLIFIGWLTLVPFLTFFGWVNRMNGDVTLLFALAAYVIPASFGGLFLWIGFSLWQRNLEKQLEKYSEYFKPIDPTKRTHGVSLKDTRIKNE